MENVKSSVISALEDQLSKIDEYIPTDYVDDSEPDLDAEHLNKAEQAIMRATSLLNLSVDAINTIADKVANQLLTNDQFLYRIDNNLLGTDPTHVLASPQGKILQKSISDLSDDLNNRTAVSDLQAEADIGATSPRIVTTNASTLNTPYSKGLTGLSSGTAYINMSSANFGTIVYVVNGNNLIFLRAKSSGTWGEWIQMISKKNIQSGRTAAITSPPKQITVYHVNFPVAFSSTPIVIANLYADSSSINYGDLQITVANISTSGFDIRLYNKYTSQFAPATIWFAYSNN